MTLLALQQVTMLVSTSKGYISKKHAVPASLFYQTPSDELNFLQKGVWKRELFPSLVQGKMVWKVEGWI